MKKNIFYVAITICAITLSSCATSKENTDKAEHEMVEKEMPAKSMKEQIAEAFNGAPYKSFKNKSATHTLCVCPSQDFNSPYVNTFLVHDGNRFVYQPRTVRGDIEWFDDRSVVFTRVLGVDPRDRPVEENQEIIQVVYEEQ